MQINSENVFGTYTRNEVSEMAKSDAHREFLDKFYQGSLYKTQKDLPIFEIKEEDFGSTGYFEKLVRRNLKHKIGTVLRGWTGDVNARRVLVLVTHVGNLVAFERYTNSDRGVIAYNAPNELSTFLGGGAMTADNVSMVFGGIGSANLAESITRIMQAFTKMDFTAERFNHGEDE